MRKITSLAIGASALFLIGVSYTGFTNSSGRTGPTSGSPQSAGQTCTQCHSGGSITSQTLSITTDIPNNEFDPNTNYNITVTSAANGGLGSRMGFNATVEDGNGFVGTVSSNGSDTKESGMAMTHTSGSNTPSNGQQSWTFKWNSGSAQSATIYVAGLFANGNGTTSGDATATETLQLTRSAFGIDEMVVSNLSLYPNPAVDFVTIEGNANTFGLTQVEITNTMGQLVYDETIDITSTSMSEQVNLSSLAHGTYILRLSQGNRVSTTKFIKL